MRDWMELFVAGKPFYDVEETTSLLVDNDIEPVLADERQQLLNDGDFNDYRVVRHSVAFI